MSSAVIESLTEATFEAKASNGKVVVEFGAKWCMPCRMLEPVIRQLAASYSGQISVMTVNTDDETSLTERFGINTVPTVLILQDGQIARRFVGLTTFERLASAVQETLDGENATGT